jgi:hypothetical protein
MATEDWREVAAAHDRDQFVRKYAHPFLLSLSGLVAPPPPPSTLRMSLDNTGMIDVMRAERRRRLTPADRSPAVLPIRKSQPTFPSMITLGRGRNNDIIVPDALVSKLHAVFRAEQDGAWTVADAGSSNGTKIGETLLPTRGAASPLRSGDEVTFGVQSFRFLSATALWVALRR